MSTALIEVAIRAGATQRVPRGLGLMAGRGYAVEFGAGFASVEGWAVGLGRLGGGCVAEEGEAVGLEVVRQGGGIEAEREGLAGGANGGLPAGRFGEED